GSTSAVTACVAELEGPRYVVFVKPREVDTDIFRAVKQRAIDAAKGPVHLDSFEDITQMQPAFRTLKVDWCGSTSAVTACVAELEGPRYVVFVKPREVDTDIF
ncbi:hypothetical protein CTI14_59185, partial [Methylobacterium radiotolerans]